jgi:peroxiredoxin
MERDAGDDGHGLGGPVPADAARRRSWPLTSIALVVVLLAVLVLLLRPAQSGPTATGSPAGQSVGFRAPDFTLRDLHGASVRLSTLRGQLVLLNFWATWCVPCRREMPALERAFRHYQTQRRTAVTPAPRFLGINTSAEDTATVGAFARAWGITYPLLLDPSWRVTYFDYHIAGIPTSIVLDARGVDRAIHLGPLTEPEIVQLLNGVS